MIAINCSDFSPNNQRQKYELFQINGIFEKFFPISCEAIIKQTQLKNAVLSRTKKGHVTHVPCPKISRIAS